MRPYDYRGSEIPTAFFKQATEASLDLAWTESYQDYSQIPVNYEAYGYDHDEMIAGTWHDYAFWRPVIFVGSNLIPGKKEWKLVVNVATAWSIIEELYDDVMGRGNPLGDYYQAYPTIKVSSQWGYLPTESTHSFLAPRSAFD